LLLSVTDTGIGMDRATLQHIFEPFFTAKETGKGTGLGLSMVYGIIRQCGGFVRVESEPGRGAKFRIYLPLAAGEIAADEDAGARAIHIRGSETVLVVEDKDNVRRLAVETLSSCGYSVLAARGGDEALALSERRTEPIDLLLTDVVMPGMNRSGLAGRLLSSRPQMKVIFMSGYPDAALGPPSAVSALHYLPKPFSPDELGRKVREVLGPSRPVGRTILVVDDESGIRKMFAAILGADNRVLLASHGTEALEILRGEEPDLVITDMVMPNHDGTEMLRAVRKLCPRAKIIAMSGAFGGQFMKTMELLGADATLVKPIDPDRLLATVEALLGQPV
jgi:CheY-like chemotaxis protein